MARIRRGLIASLLSVGVGAGLAAAALEAWNAPASRQLAAKQLASLKAPTALTPAQNRRPLSPETISELSAWGTRFARCLAGEGIALERPQAGKSQIVIRIQLSAALIKDPTALMTRPTAATGR